MTRRPSFQIHRRPISREKGAIKPLLAGFLFLGISAGLMAVYTQSPTGEMVSYHDFKQAKSPNTKNEEKVFLRDEKLIGENEIEPPDFSEKRENNIKPVANGMSTSPSLPQQTLKLIQKGMRLSEEGKHNSAEIEFEKAVELSPNSPEVHAIFGTALRIAKKYKGADRHFAMADKLAPNDNEILFNWGMSKLMVGDVDEAIRLMEHSIKINPNNPIAYNYLGKAFGRKKDFASETVSYNKALELEPNFGQAHFNLAVVLSLQKDFDGAAVHFKQAMQLDPEFKKPFVQNFLARYNSYKNVQDNTEQADSKSDAQTTRANEHKSEEKIFDGSDHNMEGSGKVEKEFTHIRGTFRINGKPLAKNAVIFLETKDKLRVPGQKTHNLTVNQQDLKFKPMHSVVMVGSTVTFINQDTEVHNIFSKSLGNQFNLGAMATGSSKTIKINDSGPIVLRCNLHKGMLGTIFSVPNGYYTQTRPDGTFVFAKVKSKEYFLQAWAPMLDPSEVKASMKSVGLNGKDAVYDFDIKSQSHPDEIRDLVDRTDYNLIVNDMEKLIYDSIASWKEGRKYKPRKQMLIAITKHFDGKGLKGAIAKSFSEKRSSDLETSLDAIRKKVSGLVKDGPITEKSLKNEAALAIFQLRLNVQKLEARIKPASPRP